MKKAYDSSSFPQECWISQLMDDLSKYHGLHPHLQCIVQFY